MPICNIVKYVILVIFVKIVKTTFYCQVISLKIAFNKKKMIQTVNFFYYNNYSKINIDLKYVLIY